jgi:hypothetical protein
MNKLLIGIAVMGIIFVPGCSDDDTVTSPVDDTPPAAITDLRIIGTVDTTALLNWTATGNDGNTGTAASYDIRYATDASILNNWIDAYRVTNPPTPKVSGSAELFEVTGLSIDSMYYFAIKTCDDDSNISSLSNIAQKTVSSFPMVQIVSPASGATIGDFVEISAVATDDKGIVRIEFYADDNYIGADFAPPYTIGWDTHTFPHESGHVIYALGTDTDDNTSSSNAVYCYTDTVLFLPEKSDIVEISEVTDSSARVTWTKNFDNDFQEYVVYYDTTEIIDYLASPSTLPIMDRSDTSCTITGLVDTAGYYFRVATYDIYYNAGYGNIDSCITLNGNPGPVHMNYPISFSDSIAVSWERSPIHDFQSYTLYRSLDEHVTTDDLMLTDIFYQDTVQFVDVSVDSGQLYYYAVLLEDAGGLSSFSNVAGAMADEVNYSLQYNGNEYCVIPHYSGLDFTTEFTLEAWVYPHSHHEYLRIIDKTESVCCLQYSLLLHIGRVGSDFGIQTVPDYERVNGSLAIPLNQWSHIAVTYSSGQVCFYINGVLDNCVVTDLTSLAAIPTDLNIGRRLMHDEFYFVGLIDEIRMWNYARNETELTDSYNHSLLGTESGLVGYWRFNEGSGDVSGAATGNDCRLGSADGSDNNDPIWIDQGAPLGY